MRAGAQMIATVQAERPSAPMIEMRSRDGTAGGRHHSTARPAFSSIQGFACANAHARHRTPSRRQVTCGG